MDSHFGIIPTFLYIVYVNRCNPFTYLKLTTNPGKGLLCTLAGILWFVLAPGYRHVLQGIPINLHLDFGTWLNMIVLVGFSEEIPVMRISVPEVERIYGVLAGQLAANLFPQVLMKGLRLS